MGRRDEGEREKMAKALLPATYPCGGVDERKAVKEILLNRFHVRDNERLVDEDEGDAARFDGRRLT